MIGMRNARSLDEKLNETAGSPEEGYSEWKRAKVEEALEQAKDRTVMIPADKLLHDLRLEP